MSTLIVEIDALGKLLALPALNSSIFAPAHMEKLRANQILLDDTSSVRIFTMKELEDEQKEHAILINQHKASGKDQLIAYSRTKKKSSFVKVGKKKYPVVTYKMIIFNTIDFNKIKTLFNAHKFKAFL